MTVQTKFNVGDTAYAIDEANMKLASFTVRSIYVYVHKDDTRITICSDGETLNDIKSYDEARCFHSEKDLLNYIKSPITD